MQIEEVDIPYLNNNPPKFKPNLYPQPYKEHIQPCYFIFGSVGCRGSGKTYSVVKILKNQEDSGFYDPITKDKVKIKHYLFSPTVAANPIFTSLKYLDDDNIINDYTDEKLIEIIDEIKAERKLVKDYRQYVECYKEYEKMSDLQLQKCRDYELLGILASKNFIDYRKLDKPDQYVYNVILDDCLANREAFSTKKANTLTKAILNSRHIGINVLICSQNLKSIPKIIRNNVDIWCLFKTKNEKVLMDDLYPEISSIVSPEEFMALYTYATTDDHDCLVYDGKEKEKTDRFKVNFDVILRWK